MHFFARPLPVLPGEILDTSWRALLRPIFVLKLPRVYLVLPSYLARTCMLGFFLSVFPELVANVSLIPYLTISTAVCLILIGLLYLWLWTRMPILFWSSAIAALLIISQILALLLIYTDAFQGTLRLVILYVIAGIFGLSESTGMSLASSYGTLLFPSDAAAFFGCLRFLEGLSVALVVALATWTSFVVVPVLIIIFSIVSVLCNIVLHRKLHEERMRTMVVSQNPLFIINSTSPLQREIRVRVPIEPVIAAPPSMPETL